MLGHQVWYCVKPEDRGRFEGMCKALFPELARNCKAFMRHKDVLLSPRVLRSFNIEVVTVKQEVGEFMVLTAGAFHSGYNQVRAQPCTVEMIQWVPWSYELNSSQVHRTAHVQELH